MKNPARAVFSLFFLGLSSASFAQGTQLWQQKSYEDFSRGTTHGIALHSDGTLALAPSFEPIYTSPSTFIWAMVAEPDGGVFIGTGLPARIYHVAPDGTSTIVYEPKELQVQTLALDKDGNLYAGTSPDGKVYKISRAHSSAQSAAYSASVFFDPKSKYIWSLALDAQGQLYVGTGDRGEIFRVAKTGEGSIFFKSDEAHIRAMAFDATGNLIAGSDGSGLVYRISAAGEGFVLYSAPKKEITALALDAAGNIYVSGVGEKRNMNMGPGALAPPIFTAPIGGGLNMLAPMVGGATGPIAGGSDIYKIAPDGSPKRIWTTKEDIVYALAFDSQGRLLAGTGNQGRIVDIGNNGDFTDLVKASANQVTAFAAAPNGSLYAATSNLGKIFRLSATTDSQGTFESDVFDAHNFSHWGRAEVRASGNFQLFARSGNVDNPDRNWSLWKPVELGKDSRITAPAARFLQWKVVVPARSDAKIEAVAINYLAKNVAPVIDEVVVQVGAKFNSSSMIKPANDTVTVNLINSQPQMPPAGMSPHSEQPLMAQKDKDSIAVRWAAHDDNDDDLVYSIYYKGDGESRWKLLKSGITEKFYSWDAGLLPDGGYTVRIVASDSPSHTPDDALTDSKVSARFEVDTTPPRIDSLAGKIVGGTVRVTFASHDSFSPIKRAEYSIDAGEWQLIEPVGQISDSLTESYDFTAPIPQPRAADEPSANGHGKQSHATDLPQTDAQPVLLSNEHVVVVRVYDRFDNVGVAKVVVK